MLAVLCGRVFNCTERRDGGILEPGFDSHAAENGSEWVLFESNQILPLFVTDNRNNPIDFPDPTIDPDPAIAAAEAQALTEKALEEAKKVILAQEGAALVAVDAAPVVVPFVNPVVDGVANESPVHVAAAVDVPLANHVEKKKKKKKKKKKSQQQQQQQSEQKSQQESEQQPEQELEEQPEQQPEQQPEEHDQSSEIKEEDNSSWCVAF